MDLRLFFFSKILWGARNDLLLIGWRMPDKSEIFPVSGETFRALFWGLGNDFTFFLFLAREVPVFEIPALLFTQMFVSWRAGGGEEEEK